MFIIIAIFCLIVACSETFEYSNSVINCIKGNSVKVISPKNSEEGIYSITPNLVKGMTLDSRKGTISGLPEVSYRGTYTITYKNPSNNESKTSIIQLNGIS